MKVGHFCTFFKASLFLFVAFSSSVALSDGSCYLTQYANGEYVIRCEGDGIWINYVEHTNEVYIIENCVTLKANLLSALDSVYSDLEPVYADVRQILDSSSVISQNTPDSFEGIIISGQVDSIINTANSILRSLDDVSYDLLASDGSIPTLRYQIQSIECGSCSTNSSGGGSCCDVDLTPILDRLNSSNKMLSLVTNVLYGTFGTRNFNNFMSLPSNPGGKLLSPTVNTFKWFGNGLHDNNILNNLNIINENLASAFRSVNNYLYKINFVDLPSISNNVEHLYIDSTNYFSSATNHFSLFRKMTFQDSPLIDYSEQSTFDNYYDFLTNHYVKVSFKQYDDLVGDEKSKTNWFSRIETLLAALVFNDSEGTNTVDDTYGQSQQGNLINSLDGMSDTSVVQVNLMSSMGDSMLSSLRSLNSSFSSAVSMPAEVKLATVGPHNNMQSTVVRFQSSEISQLVEACRCATTLAWCFGGIWLLFLFVSWSVKTSYSLCVFCWSVVSAIFGGGKT